MKDIRYMLRLVWRADRNSFLYVALYLLWTAIPTSISLLIYKLLIDAFSGQRGLAYMLLLVAVYVLATLLDYVIRMAVMNVGVDITLRMRMEKLLNAMLLEKVKRMDAAQFDNPEQYDQIMLAVNGINTQSLGVFMSLYMLLSGIVRAMVGIGLMAFISPWLILAIVAVEVGSYFYNISFSKRKVRALENLTPLTRRTDYFRSALFQRSTAFDIKQYTSLGELLLCKFTREQDAQQEARRKVAWSQQLHSLKLQLINLVSTALIPYTYVSIGLFRQWFSVADMTVLLGAFQSMHSTVSSLSLLAADLKENALYVQQLRKVLDYAPTIEIEGGAELSADDFTELTFTHVSFKYSNSDNFALEDVCFTLKKGEKLALVGVNGAGKTTLIKLLLRFYDPTSGTITMNGRDIRELNVEALRRTVTSVFQEYPMYALPLDELVACMDRECVDDARVADALKRAGLWAEVAEQRSGIRSEYSKYFDEAGLVFSGGQLQRLAIARMLYKDSPILVMDEPSSALDPEQEYALNRDILTVSAGKTVLLISHRLSAIRDFDQILLLENGRLLERGNHASLMAANGRYAHLFSLQAAGYA